MVDQMVLQAQKWVNQTYGSVPGYRPCDETGRTGWDTVFSLTRALQHELGITTLSDNFGPTTFARLSRHGPVGVSSSTIKMRMIAEAALYCKGYSGGAIDGAFKTDTQTGLTSIVRDMGLPITTMVADVTPKVFKALLNMDSYVLTGEHGSEAVQKCQRWLNGAYGNRGQFFVGPCDGHFSRNAQAALVYAIQYQLGLTDSQVTGAIGPGTRAGLQARATVRNGSRDNGATGWVRLFQCALAFNNYGNRWNDSEGAFNADMERIVKVFQRFRMLAETGAGDYQTWMSLLVPTGDPERFGNAIDWMMPLNSARLQTVENCGHRSSDGT